MAKKNPAIIILGVAALGMGAYFLWKNSTASSGNGSQNVVADDVRKILGQEPIPGTAVENPTTAMTVGDIYSGRITAGQVDQALTGNVRDVGTLSVEAGSQQFNAINQVLVKNALSPEFPNAGIINITSGGSALGAYDFNKQVSTLTQAGLNAQASQYKLSASTPTKTTQTATTQKSSSLNYTPAPTNYTPAPSTKASAPVQTATKAVSYVASPITRSISSILSRW